MNINSSYYNISRYYNMEFPKFDTSESITTRFYKQTLDPMKARKMLDSGYNVLYEAEWIKEWNIKGFTDGRTHLEKILNMSRNGVLMPTIHNTEQGRYVYHQSISIGLLSAPFRHTLCKGEYIDYDMTNAHYVILNELCRLAKVPKQQYENISRYVKDRDALRQEIAKDLFPDREFKDVKDNIKRLFLLTLYGGSFEKWAKENNLDDKVQPHTIIVGMKNEMKSLIDMRIKNANPLIWLETFEKVKKHNEKNKKLSDKNQTPYHHKNADARFLSIFLQSWERKIIEVALCYMEEQNHIKDNVLIYTFDGFMIKYQEDMDTDEVCRGLRGYIRERLDMDMGWETKDFDKALDEEFFPKKKDYVFPEDKLMRCDFNYLNEIRSYEEKKAYFECFVVKTIDPMMYWVSSHRVDDEGRVSKHITYYNDDQLKKAYQEIKLNEAKKSNNKGDTNCPPFVNRWFDDADKIIKYRHDFIPYPTDPKERVEKDNGIFNIFTGYNDACFKDIEPQENILDGFMYVLKNLVGGTDENLEEFNTLIATKIQNPHIKIDKSFLIKSRQGEGKNTCMDAIGSVLGKAHYFYTSNVNDIFGTHAEGTEGKLLVILNEMDIGATKSITSAFKSYITEDTLRVNPKNLRPFDVRNLALVGVLSNEESPIFIDSREGDRRWYIFEGNKKNRELPRKCWEGLYSKIKTEEFINALYKFYMNYKSEKSLTSLRIRNSHKDAYKSVVCRYIKPEAIFLHDYITQKTCLEGKDDDECNPHCRDEIYYGYSSYDALDHKPHSSCLSKNISWYCDEQYLTNTFEFKGIHFLHDFQLWLKSNSFSMERSNKSSKAFYNNLMSLDCGISRKRKNGNVEHLFFQPYKVLEGLTKSNMIEMEEDYKESMRNSVKKGYYVEKTIKDALKPKEAPQKKDYELIEW